MAKEFEQQEIAKATFFKDAVLESQIQATAKQLAQRKLQQLVIKIYKKRAYNNYPMTNFLISN